MEYIVCYLIIINIVAYFTFAIDKKRAKRGAYRIPESTLMATALLGGEFGAMLAMHFCRHKTKKLKFKLGVPACLILHIVLAAMYIFLFNRY